MPDLVESLVDEILTAVTTKLHAQSRTSKRVYTLEEACEYTGLTADAIRCKVAAGQMPVVRIDRRLRFDRKALDKWIEDNTRYDE